MRQTARLADGLVFCLFLGVPLAASPLFWDQFTTVKWYVLELVAAVWLLSEASLRPSPAVPSFVRRHRLAFAVLGLLVAASCFRLGAHAAGTPLLDRAAVAILALCFFWRFSRGTEVLQAATIAVGLAALLVDAYGLAQFAGFQPFPFLTAGDQRSAFFGNVNLTAQFLGFAVVFLLAALSGTAPRLLRVMGETTLALSLAYLYLLSSRSVGLALLAAIGAWTIVRRVPLGPLARAAVGAALVAWLLPGAGSLEAVREHKWLTVAQRLSVWKGTLRMIRDHPLGVGAGNFSDVFLGYGADVPLLPREDVVFLHPHNEYLRLLAEEGLIVGGLALYLTSRLVRDLRRALDAGWWRSPSGLVLLGASAFLAVEAFFQFPLSEAFGALTAALLVGLASSSLEPVRASPSDVPARVSASVVIPAILTAAGILIMLARVAASELLFVNRKEDLPAQDRACRLNPRNLPACVTAAWLEAGNGQVSQARQRLVHVLDGAPRYFPAIKLLSEISLSAGDREAGCLYLGAYDALFQGRSSIHHRLQEQGCDPAAVQASLARAAWPRGRFPYAAADATLRSDR